MWKTTLRKRHIPFQKDHYTVQGKITPCIVEEDTEKSNLLLDFLTHVIEFKQAEHDLYKEVLACLRENCTPKRGWLFLSKPKWYTNVK